jgi:hypothetical protein
MKHAQVPVRHGGLLLLLLAQSILWCDGHQSPPTTAAERHKHSLKLQLLS